jgi:hypothetical protein
MTGLAIDPATTPGYSRVSSAGQSATALPQFRANGTSTVTIEVEPTPAWLYVVEARLNELLALGPGWDTYGAQAIERSYVLDAVNLLVQLTPPDAPAPWIVPTAGRGVQLEWQTDDVEVEVRVDDDGVHIFVLDASGEDEGDPVRRPDLCVRATQAITIAAAVA